MISKKNGWNVTKYNKKPNQRKSIYINWVGELKKIVKISKNNLKQKKYNKDIVVKCYKN
jgi:hypothetical protein